MERLKEIDNKDASFWAEQAKILAKTGEHEEVLNVFEVAMLKGAKVRIAIISFFSTYKRKLAGIRASLCIERVSEGEKVIKINVYVIQSCVGSGTFISHGYRVRAGIGGRRKRKRETMANC